MIRRDDPPSLLAYYTPGVLPGRASPMVRGQVVRQGYAYWCARQRPGRLPSRRDIDPVALRGLLPQVLLLDVQCEPWDFRFRLIGGNLLYHLGADWTGEWMTRVPETRPPNGLFDSCCQVARSGQPHRGCTPFSGWHPAIRQCDGVILPLAADGRQPDTLLLFVEFVAAPCAPR